jgi:N-acetylglutamate synthase-like GNAT family acetyltransferase
MKEQAVVRPMRPSDFRGIVALDRAVTGNDRSLYYERKFRVLEDPDTVNMCLTAELDGTVVGFVMGDMFTGEYGVPEATAAIDTIGVHPGYQDHGIGTDLFAQFRSNLKALNVRTCYVLVEWGDWELSKFFQKEGFVPSNRVNLELNL